MKLRAPLTGAVLLAFLVAVPAGAHRHRPDHVIVSFGDAWNEPDVKVAVDAMVDLFEEEGVFYYPDASYAKGRQAIKKLLKEILGNKVKPVLTIDKVNLKYHQPGHWASIDRKAKRTKGDETTELILSAVLTQTKDGPGVEECKEDKPNEPCDEWSLVSLWIVKDSVEDAEEEK